jgi:uncharacterized protein (DUF433 family)
MDWKDRIISDKTILRGKPVIKGTRLSVEFIVGRLADGWSEQQILENYPGLTRDDLLAVFSYIDEAMKDGLIFNYTLKLA